MCRIIYGNMHKPLSVFSIASVNGVETVDNKYRFIIRGDENTGEISNSSINCN